MIEVSYSPNRFSKIKHRIIDRKDSDMAKLFQMKTDLQPNLETK